MDEQEFFTERSYDALRFRGPATDLSELELTFFHGLFDENVSSHMALGNGITGVVRGSERLTSDERRAAGMSTSIVHHDFTIGGPEIDVSGVTKDGREEPLMVGGRWQSPP